MYKLGHDLRRGWGDFGVGWGSLLRKGPGGSMGMGCVSCRGTRNVYQSVLLESCLIGAKRELSSNPRIVCS